MAVTVLDALYNRRLTGKGRRLQGRNAGCHSALHAHVLAMQARTRRPAQRRGGQSVSGNNPPFGLFPGKPGGLNDYVYITASRADPEHWKRLLKS